jgi:hypothetical protein
MFSVRWKTPADPRAAGRIITDHVVPLLTQDSCPDHTETHIWGVAPRIVRQGLHQISR